MNFERGICRMLHDEHRATIEAMDGLEDLLARGGRGVPDLDQAASRKLLERLARMAGGEVRRHFDFEESAVFTRLAEAGNAEIGALLTEEHKVILPVWERVAAIAHDALGNGMSEPGWEEFRGLSAELIERMHAHIKKEDMVLLPLLEEALEADEDLALVASYSDMGA